uniref:Uncharacterized protein n=1 Tax=Acrobeloides nanus TaxID=290746 RepID=A0A914BUN7_9BILA
MLQDVAMAIIKPLKKPASVTAKQSQIGTAGGISIGVVLLAVLLVASCLGVLYYRNKYNKEKDPAFPTISYYPDDEQYSRPEFNDVNHEFHNPLSFRKDIIASEEDEITNRKLYQEKSLDFDRNQNEPYEVPSSRSTVDPTNGYSRFTNVSKNNSSGPA